jgi:hypothetical protein
MANTYYVATNGSNDNPGTLERPFASINDATNKVQPGDKVYVRGGTYNLNREIWIGNSGTADQRIVFESYPGETAILDGSNLSAFYIVGLVGQYIDFKGFEVRNSQGFGISVWKGKHIRILDNVVHGSSQGAIRAGADDDKTATQDIVISGNTVYNNGLVNKARNTGWPAIVASNGATNVTMTNNHIYENYGEGIDFIATDIGLASGNRLHDNYAANLYLDNASNIKVEKNFIYTTNNTNHYRDGHPATGIQAANEPYGISNPLNKVEISNNIVVGGQWGFYYGTYGNGGGLKNFTIVNNTFYGATESLIEILDDPGHSKNVISKNIFYKTGNELLSDITAKPTELGFSNNLWYGGTAGAAEGFGDLKADPLFVNARGLLPSDYALKAGSPALAAGIGSLPFNLNGGTTPVGGGTNQPIPIDTGVPTAPKPVNQDIVLQVSTAAGDPVELLDLRGVKSNGNGQAVKVAFSEVTSEAKFDNSVGFYVVQNEQGTVIDPLSGQAINPGDSGYAEAALRQRVTGLDIERNTQSLLTPMNGGVLLAPYIICDGTVDQFLAENPGNLPNSGNRPGEGLYAYFAYQGANPDKADHVRLLGNNQFGFEDRWAGGDNDFNDMIFKLNVEIA